MTGRPSLYTEELVDEICLRLANGQSLNAMCKLEGMPDKSTFLKWLAKAEEGDETYSGLIDKYLRAREIQADTIFDECLDIADESGADAIYNKKTGTIQIEGEVISRAKLRIDTRMRMAGKLKPKKYGDKVDFTTAGESLNDARAVDARLAQLLGKAGVDKAVGSEGTAGG